MVTIKSHEYPIGRIHLCVRLLEIFAFAAHVVHVSKKVLNGVQILQLVTIGEYGISTRNLMTKKGTSIVFVHTTKGKNILNAVKEQIVRIEIDVEDAFRENMSMMLSSVAHEKRGEFLDRVMSENFGELVNNYFPPVVIEKQNMWKCAKKLLDKYLNRK